MYKVTVKNKNKIVSSSLFVTEKLAEEFFNLLPIKNTTNIVSIERILTPEVATVQGFLKLINSGELWGYSNIQKVVSLLTVKLKNCPIFGIHEVTQCRMAKIKKVGLYEYMAYKIARSESYIGLGVVVMVCIGIILTTV